MVPSQVTVCELHFKECIGECVLEPSMWMLYCTVVYTIM